jgi:hypothetical protein
MDRDGGDLDVEHGGAVANPRARAARRGMGGGGGAAAGGGGAAARRHGRRRGAVAGLGLQVLRRNPSLALFI